MSDYTQTTFWTPKGRLATGQDKKILYGKHLDAELVAVQVAIATKAEGGSNSIEVTRGTWTPNWALGFADGIEPTGDLVYERWADASGNEWVSIGIDGASALQAVTNATTIRIDDIPVVIRPTETVTSTACALVNNGSAVLGAIGVTLGGRFVFYHAQASNAVLSAVFTSGAIGGLPTGTSFTYSLRNTA